MRHRAAAVVMLVAVVQQRNPLFKHFLVSFLPCRACPPRGRLLRAPWRDQAVGKRPALRRLTYGCDACRSSKQRMPGDQQLQPAPMVSPERTQERNKNTSRLGASRPHPPPEVQFEETQAEKAQGTGSIAEVLAQGVISVSPALASPHTQKKAREFPGSSVVKTLYFGSRESGSIPGQGTKVTHVMQCSLKK